MLPASFFRSKTLLHLQGRLFANRWQPSPSLTTFLSQKRQAFPMVTPISSIWSFRMSKVSPLPPQSRSWEDCQAPELSHGVSQYLPLPCPAYSCQYRGSSWKHLAVRLLHTNFESWSLCRGEPDNAFQGGDFLSSEQPGGHFHAGTEPRHHPLHSSGEPGIEASANEALAVAQGKGSSRVAKWFRRLWRRIYQW